MSRIEPVDDLSGIAFELAMHPSFVIVVPDAAGQKRRDEAVACRARVAASDRYPLIGELSHADADDAAMVRIDHSGLLQHRGGPQIVRCQSIGRRDEGT